MAPKRSERSGNMSIRHVIILAQNKTNKQTNKEEMKPRQKTLQPCPELETPTLRPRQECWER